MIIKKVPVAGNMQTRKQLLVLGVVLLLCVIGTVRLLAAPVATLADRSLTVSDSRAAVTARYTFRFRPTTTDPIQLVQLEVCANDPFPGTPCTAPTGFDASAAVLMNQSGDSGFTISPLSTANRIVLERPPAPSNAQLNSYEFGGIVNPANKSTYYVRFQTFAGNSLSGPANGNGGGAFAITSGVDINATVPPYLLFCVGVTVQGLSCSAVSGNYLNLGEFSSRQASQGTTQMLAATNAIDGYTIRINGRTLTSGINTIPALPGADISRPGVSQFGLNLRANSAPAGGQDVTGTGNGVPVSSYDQPNFFRFNSGDVVAASNAPDEARKYTTTYIVNVSTGQAPGVYVSTMSYVALGNF